MTERTQRSANAFKFGLLTGSLASLVFHRVNASGSLQTRTAPERMAPPPGDLVLMVAENLRQQPLCCALCGGLMRLQPENKLLQPSPDRIDSTLGTYGPGNFQLAHLACNLAKNDSTVVHFQEWLDVASARPSDTGTESDIA